MHFAVIVTIILLLVIAGFLIYFFATKWGPWISERSDEEICRLSVLAMAKGQIPYLRTGSPFSLRCKTKYLKIEESDKNAIKEELANAMYRCWWQYGEGKLDFFSDWEWKIGQEEHCMICSIIKFDETVTETSIRVEEFEKYLDNKQIPGKGRTYSEFFLDAEKAEMYFGEESRGGRIEINHEEPLYVVFGVIKTRTPIEGKWYERLRDFFIKEGKIFGIGFLGTVGLGAISTGGIAPLSALAKGGLGVGIASMIVAGVAHKDHFYPTLFLIPGEEIRNECTKLD